MINSTHLRSQIGGYCQENKYPHAGLFYFFLRWAEKRKKNNRMRVCFIFFQIGQKWALFRAYFGQKKNVHLINIKSFFFTHTHTGMAWDPILGVRTSPQKLIWTGPTPQGGTHQITGNHRQARM